MGKRAGADVGLWECTPYTNLRPVERVSGVVLGCLGCPLNNVDQFFLSTLSDRSLVNTSRKEKGHFLPLGFLCFGLECLCSSCFTLLIAILFVCNIFRYFRLETLALKRVYAPANYGIDRWMKWILPFTI